MGNVRSGPGLSPWVIVLAGFAATIGITVLMVHVQSIVLGIWSKVIAGDQRPDFSSNGAQWLDLAMLFIVPLEALMIAVVFVIVLPYAYWIARTGEVPLTGTRISGITTAVFAVVSIAVFGPDLLGLSLAVPTLAITYLSIRAFVVWAELQRRA